MFAQTKKIKKMKKGLLLLAFVGTLFAFKAASTYKVDVNKSKISWVGKKVTGQHTGEIALSSGALNVDGAKITGGNFVINMNSITATDVQGEMAAKLVGHLKAEDFFGTEKYPTAKFVITKTAPIVNGKATISGNLTIKGITQSISFPATVSQKGNNLVAVAKVMVDRTKYGLKYGSKSFFDSLGDKAIDDEFEINISLVASK